VLQCICVQKVRSPPPPPQRLIDRFPLQHLRPPRLPISSCAADFAALAAPAYCLPREQAAAPPHYAAGASPTHQLPAAAVSASFYGGGGSGGSGGRGVRRFQLLSSPGSSSPQDLPSWSPAAPAPAWPGSGGGPADCGRTTPPYTLVGAASPGGSRSLAPAGARLHGAPPTGAGGDVGFRGGWSLVGPGGLEIQWPAGACLGAGGLEVPARVRGYREMA
jgi:hypothetical protein